MYKPNGDRLKAVGSFLGKLATEIAEEVVKQKVVERLKGRKPSHGFEPPDDPQGAGCRRDGR